MEPKERCVLLADGHQEMLEGIRGLLTTEFEAVVMVSDEASLFEAAERMAPDIVVVDLSLPIEGEANVVRRLRSRYPALTVIVLSVHDEAIAVDAALDAGAQGFVLKRTAATDLLGAVAQVREGHTYVSPSARRGV